MSKTKEEKKNVWNYVGNDGQRIKERKQGKMKGMMVNNNGEKRKNVGDDDQRIKEGK